MLRGLPGAGKSTLAEVLAAEEDVKISIDDFFTDPVSGKYQFDHRTNHLAYRHCEERVKKAMGDNRPRIFCHNVFSRTEEMAPYLTLAKEAGYRVFVVTVENYHGGGNRHEISEEQVQKMRDKYKLSL
ncbi:MAG: ATP-binding protein [Bacteroidia bacterium]|nr:ATP-binding protein [Bacteroidia bacterium]